MARKSYLFTSESVSEGHPDKVCDRISDEIVDLFFREGPKAGIDPWAIRAACETLATTNKVIIAGETRGPETVTKDWIAHVARMAIRDIGYEQDGFHWDKADIEVLLHPQSADIAAGVDALQPGDNKEEGAGDQGIMFGYACTETPELMPAPIYYAHNILHDLAIARHKKEGGAALLGPDSKSQVTVRYEDGKAVGVTQIVVSHQHIEEDLSSKKIRDIIEPYVRKTLPDGWITKDTVWHVNPTGKFFIGGPDGDTGLTGRKIIVDTYGGAAPHGGGAFSGKDSDQGRSLGRLCGALSCQERRRGRPRRPLHHPAFLRHRRCQAAVDLCRHARHRQGRRGDAGKSARRGDGSVAARHPQASRPQQADLRAHLGLRPLRASAGGRRRFLLGEDRPCRCHQEGRRLSSAR